MMIRDDEMDMYYFLKDKLECQDCKHPLKYNKDIGYMSYIATCISCDQKFEINLEVKNVSIQSNSIR